MLHRGGHREPGRPGAVERPQTMSPSATGRPGDEREGRPPAPKTPRETSPPQRGTKGTVALGLGRLRSCFIGSTSSVAPWRGRSEGGPDGFRKLANEASFGKRA